MYESANVSDEADRTAFRASRETIQTLLRTRLKVLEKEVSYLNRSICHRFSISIQFHKISTRPVLYPHGIRVAESDSSVFCIENRPGKVKIMIQ
ncbi:hypothetical protein F2Q69_00063455 [Brassica cretica]|uniref:Uncharacterized protein n=1 Tax=Brassica cretica TaxID=69181 RepID=A0A8S9RLE0_BRACR|nr:hypothetical protein F2Q69_00063455 [Brassica cretica]